MISSGRCIGGFCHTMGSLLLLFEGACVAAVVLVLADESAFSRLSRICMSQLDWQSRAMIAVCVQILFGSKSKASVLD
jgi:hypothetical protein